MAFLAAAGGGSAVLGGLNIAGAAGGLFSSLSGGGGGTAKRMAREVNRRQRYYNQRLMDLMEHPETILQDPGYELSFGQGIQAVERSSAAKGFTGSGNAAIALQNYGQSFASTYLRDQERLLASLSGAQGGGANPAALLQVAGQQQNNQFEQFGQILAGLGYGFGGMGAGGSSSGGGSSGGESPPVMDAGGGYIWNVPGTAYDG